MAEGEEEMTRGYNMKPPTRLQIAKWVQKAWEMVPSEIIKKSFIVCGVSNALDNSEDESISVLEPQGILHDKRDRILQNLRQLTENDVT